jgi:hypothetical protein
MLINRYKSEFIFEKILTWEKRILKSCFRKEFETENSRVDIIHKFYLNGIVKSSTLARKSSNPSTPKEAPRPQSFFFWGLLKKDIRTFNFRSNGALPFYQDHPFYYSVERFIKGLPLLQEGREEQFIKGPPSHYQNLWFWNPKCIFATC